MRLAWQRLKAPPDLLQGFGDGRHSAAGRLVVIDYLIVEQYLEQAVMGLNQLRPDPESIGHCCRQTGGLFEKTSFHTVMDSDDSRS